MLLQGQQIHEETNAGRTFPPVTIRYDLLRTEDVDVFHFACSVL